MTPRTDDIEERLRERFRADAAGAAAPSPGLAAAARAAAGAPPRRRPRWAAGVLAAAAVLGVVAASTAWVLTRGDDGPTQVTVARPEADGRLPDRPGAVVPLPSSGWEPGDDAMTAAFDTEVTVDADGCVTPGLLWPDGYAARREADGSVSILDPTGKVVLREGDRFTAGGGPGPRGLPCARPDGESFAMMTPPIMPEVSTATPPPSPPAT
jgi:hypothetical protein